MTTTRQVAPTTKKPHFATLLVMALAPEQIGARIRKARKAKGLTHEQFARLMDVSLRTAQRWQDGRNSKTGKVTLPRLDTLMEIADKLEVSRSYFVEVEDSEPRPASQAARLAKLEAEVERLRRRVDREDDEPGAEHGPPRPKPRR